jgi:hypothetical protein
MPTSTLTPSCTTRTDIYRRVIDTYCTTSGLIGQTLTRSTCSTCPLPLSMSTTPPPSCTARLTESGRTSTRTFHSSLMLVTPDMSTCVENPDGTFQAPASLLMMKTTCLTSFGGNNHHLIPSVSSRHKRMCVYMSWRPCRHSLCCQVEFRRVVVPLRPCRVQHVELRRVLIH